MRRVHTRLRHGEAPFVCTHVTFAAQSKPGGSPEPDFVLVVRVKRSRVKYEWLASVHVVCTIFIPHVAVNQTGLDAPPLALQGIQKAGYDFPKRSFRTASSSGVVPCFLASNSKALPRRRENMTVQLLSPAVDVLRQVAVTGRGMETEFAGWRCRLLMKLREALCQFIWVCRLLAHVAKLGQHEVADATGKWAIGVDFRDQGCTTP